MKRVIFFFSVLVSSMTSIGQTPFWTENFGTNAVCGTVVATAYTGTNGAWTVTNTGTNDLAANEWYVSAKEAGMGVGNCGNDCSTTPTLTNRTLHVSTSSLLFGDIGAAYSAGPGLSNTNKRAQSPTINCSGQSNIVLRFNYIMWGVPNQDYTQVMYSADNGNTWSGLGIPPQTPTNTCAGQGIWTSYSVALPASANNNSTVKIGFRWQNISSSGADPSFAVDDITLTAGAAVTPSLSPTFTLPVSVCQNGSVSVTANTGTVTASGYTWSASPSGPVIASPNASSTAISFPSAGVFSITLTASSGTQVASHTKTIQVQSGPSLSVSATATSLCAGSSSTLTVNGGNTYTWQPGNIIGASLVVTPTTGTTYSVSSSSTLGCNSTSTLQVSVNAAPALSISATNTTVCIGTLETLTASGASTYTWLPGNSNGSSLIIAPTANTIYTVNGTSSAGCSGSQTIAITAITCTGTSVHDLALSGLGIEVYPNPVKEILVIKIPVSVKKGILEVKDMNGKRIYQSELSGTQHQINVSGWREGIYFITCESEGKLISEKIRVVKN